MAYTLSKTDGGTLVLLNDGVIDNELTSVGLIGKNVSNFGDVQNENFLHLLENFSYNFEPRSPLQGQLWFNTTDRVFRPAVFDDTNWRPLAISWYGTSPTDTIVNVEGAPFAASRPGDFWFDSVNKQLHVVTSGTTVATQTTLIGPESVAGFGITKMSSAKMFDNLGTPHAVIQTIVNGEVISIQSPDTFVQTLQNPISGFSKVYRGITFKNYSSSTFTASASDISLYGLHNQLDQTFVRRNFAEHIQSNWSIDSTNLLYFGTSEESSIYWDNSLSSIFLDSTSNIKLKSGTSELTFNGNSLSVLTNVVNLGTTSHPFGIGYISKISSGNSSTVGSLEGDWKLTTNSKLNPSSDIQNDLGSFSNRFNTVYSKTLNAGTSSNSASLVGAWKLSPLSTLSPETDLSNSLGTSSNRFNIVYTTGISAGSAVSSIVVTGSPHVSGDIVPSTDNTYSLGTNSLKWNNVIANNIKSSSATITDLWIENVVHTSEISAGSHLSSILFTGTPLIEGNLLPNTPNLYSIGSNSLKWDNVFVNNITATFATITDTQFDTIDTNTIVATNILDRDSTLINKFDTDGTLTADSNNRLSTQKAVKTYIDQIASQLQLALSNIKTVPVGSIFYSAGTTPPTGYLVANGASYATASFPDLFEVIGYTYGGSGANFRVPDLRGEFVRGADLGRGVDTGRVLGSHQTDDFKSHNHANGNFTRLLRPPYGGSLTGNDVTGSGAEQAVGVNDSADIQPIGGTETRPRNIALLPIIKY